MNTTVPLTGQMGLAKQRPPMTVKTWTGHSSSFTEQDYMCSNNIFVQTFPSLNSP